MKTISPVAARSSSLTGVRSPQCLPPIRSPCRSPLTTRSTSPACCKRRRTRAPATCWRMARERAWRTRSWQRSRTGLRSAASRRCAISFRTWSVDRSGRTRRGLPRPPSAPRSRKRRFWLRLALFAGGKSFGGRMTSQAQAASPLPGVRGLVFLGFPLHPPGRPSDERGKHLFDVQIPMLFLQGTRDAFADLQLLEPLLEQLGARATLKLFHRCRSFVSCARAHGTQGFAS